MGIQPREPRGSRGSKEPKELKGSKGLYKIVLGLLVIFAVSVTGCGAPKEAPATAPEAPQTDVAEQEAPKEAGTFEKGAPVPEITLPNLDGEAVSLSNYQGQYVLINFWATWCKYCEREIPDLEAFDKENEDVTVFAVNVGEPRDLVAPYAEKHKMEAVIVLDETRAVSEQYGVSAYPTTVVLDKKGQLIGIVPGQITPEQLVELRQILNDYE